jgi:hypothetical protein
MTLTADHVEQQLVSWCPAWHTMLPDEENASLALSVCEGGVGGGGLTSCGEVLATRMTAQPPQIHTVTSQHQVSSKRGSSL